MLNKYLGIKFYWLLLSCNGYITVKGIFSVVTLKINKVNFYGASPERIKYHETQSWGWKRLPKIEDTTETQRYNEPPSVSLATRLTTRPNSMFLFLTLQ